MVKSLIKVRITVYTILKIFVVFFNNLERVIRDREQIKINKDNDGINENFSVISIKRWWTKLTKFEELGIKNPILTALTEINFQEAFPIQAAAIPILLSGQDVIGQAHTGTGKTAAFSLPIIQNIIPIWWFYIGQEPLFPNPISLQRSP